MIVILPSGNGMHLLLCYDSKQMVLLLSVSTCVSRLLFLSRFVDNLIIYHSATVVLFCPPVHIAYCVWCAVDEGVYVDTSGRMFKNVILQWGELPHAISMSCISNSVLVSFHLQ